MAIEDGYELALTLSEAAKGTPAGKDLDVKAALQSYQLVRTQPLFFLGLYLLDPIFRTVNMCCRVESFLYG